MQPAAKTFIDTMRASNSFDACLAMQKVNPKQFNVWLNDNDFKEEFLKSLAETKMATIYSAQYGAMSQLSNAMANGVREVVKVTEYRERNHALLRWEDIKETVKTSPVDVNSLMKFLDLKQGMTLGVALVVLQEANIFPAWFIEFILAIADDEKRITEERFSSELQDYMEMLSSDK